MKEFSSNLPTIKGLRAQFKPLANSGELIYCHNFKPTERGYLSFDPVTLPLSYDLLQQHNIHFDWPFPQLFVGKSVVLLAARNNIYMINPLEWTIAELVTYDILNQSNEKNIPSGHAWSFIDMFDVWMLTNGACAVISSETEQILGLDGKVFVAETPLIGCGCYHQGRVFMGGFNPTQFWSSTWQTFWDTWQDKVGPTGLDFDRQVGGELLSMPIKDTFVWWSSIGGGDALSFFYPASTGAESGPTDAGNYDSTKPWLLEHWQKNEQGFAPMPYNGKVMAILPLAQYVIVYSTAGVVALEAIASPEPTMRQIYLGQVGIQGQNAVDGDLQKHVFMDHSGNLWALDANLQLRNLGYREYFTNSLGTEITVAYTSDPKTTGFGEFYISDGYEHYMYNGQGLATTSQAVTSANYFQGKTIGFGTDMTVDTYEGLLVYDRFDFNWPGDKSLESVAIALLESSVDDAATLDVKVAIDYRYKKTDSYKTTAYRSVNAEGFVYFPVFGLDFRIRIKVNDYTKVDINAIRINIKTSDKRYVRGLLSTPGSS